MRFSDKFDYEKESKKFSLLKEMAVFLFDIDSIISYTIHEEAWKAAAIEWKIIPDDYNFTPFYVKYILGEPGEAGAFNILSLLHDKNKSSYYETNKITNINEMKKLAEVFRNPIKQKYLNKFIFEGSFKINLDILKIIFLAKKTGIVIGAISSSENSEEILKKINAKKVYEELGFNFNSIKSTDSLFDIFDITALGIKKYWNSILIDKLQHYCLAKGMIINHYLKIVNNSIPSIIVFEDNIKAISSISNSGFYCIGISRKSNLGLRLITKKQLLDAGSKLVYNDTEIKKMPYHQFRQDLIKMLFGGKNGIGFNG
jgi:hypothetical protein